VPAYARIEVRTENTVLAEESAIMAQAGAIARFPYVRANTVKHIIELYDLTGGIKSVSSSVATVDPAAIKSLGAIPALIPDAPTEPTADQELLGELELKRTILEERVKIKEAEEKLAN
jgi:hypothetical protein